jgi:hypothetical protein
MVPSIDVGDDTIDTRSMLVTGKSHTGECPSEVFADYF